MAMKKKAGNKKQSKPLVYVLKAYLAHSAMSLGLVALAAPIDAKADLTDRKHANTQSCREGVLRTFSQHCSAHASRKNAVGSRVRSAALSI